MSTTFFTGFYPAKANDEKNTEFIITTFKKKLNKIT